jgi:hypothetical protein
MTLTEQQTQKANKLLDELCKSGHLDAENVYPLFDTERDAEYVCSILERKELIIAHWNDGNKIALIVSNEDTCNAVDNKLLDKELVRQAKSDDKAQLETEILKLQKDSLEYQFTIREQQDRIRNLEEQNKFIELLKGYWWVFLICIGIGAGLLELWDIVVP